jgi:PAS domain S-box-containing protein
MAPDAAQPPRTPVLAPDAARPDESGTHRHVEDRTGDPSAVAHPIEPSFRHFAESLSDLVWSARPDGYPDYYNRRFLDYLGLTPGAMGGWTWAEMLHPDDGDGARRAWEQAFTTGGEYEVEFRLRRHDGVYRWHRSHGSPRRDEAGHITRWFGTCTDIDDRRRAEERLRDSEERFRSLMEQSPFSVQVFSPDGRIVRVNRAWEHLWGVTLEMVAEYNVLADPQLEARGLLPLVRRAFDGEVVRIPAHRDVPEETVPGRTRDQDLVRWIESVAYPIKGGDGRVREVVVIHEDITVRRRAEEALREGQERLRLALGAGRMGTWDWDLRTGRVAWSDGMEEVHGLPPGGFDGTIEGFRRMVHPEDRGRLEAAIARSIEGVSGYEAEFRILRPDGSVGWMLGKGTALADATGRAARMVGVGMDITERKRAEEALRQSERRFARFMQHLPGLAWLKDSQGRYVYANDDAVRAFGVPREALYGRTDEEVFPPDTAAAFRGHDRRALESGAGVRAIETLEHPDGTVHHSLVSKFPIPSPEGENALVGGMAIDITDRLEMEAALKEADRRKDEFLATLAHELRNPLAPLRNGLEIMRLAGDDRGAVDEARTLMERQVMHVVRLIDDLMDVSRITRGKLELRRERVELAAVVQAAVDTSRPLIHSTGHEVSVTLPARPILLDADPTRLSQVFSNLLNNAAKYTEPGGDIALVVERRGGEVVVTVRDSGVGIPAPMLPRVFDMFTQVDRSLEKSHGGLGIGLAIVKRLVEMHGGSVEARSEGPGMGSEFIVRLPAVLSVVHGELGQDEGRQTGPMPRHRILVVDDNEDAAGSLAMMLKLMGNEVRTAHDGEAGIAAAGAYRPDLIVLDIGMPRLNGFDACRRIREQPWGRDIFIVALTGWGQDDDRRRSHEAGFDHHLVKPVEPAALEKFLESVALRRAK